MKKIDSYKLAAMSDLHGYLPEEVEECDIICICGDILPLEIQRSYTDSLVWLEENFLSWIDKLPCKKVFVIGGNHDFILANITEKAINRMIREKTYGDKLVYLDNSLYEYNGLRIYGCPQVINLSGWAFYTSDEREFRNIPQCDILLTHNPPRIGNLGYVARYGELGSQVLAENLLTHKIKYWFCGHIHEGNHELVEENGCKLRNVSIKDDRYQVVYPITYCELKV